MNYSIVRKLGLLAAGLILVTAIPASAARRSRPSYFDGQRKGLVMGIGLGYVPVVSERRGCAPTEAGLGYNLLFGQGWNESNITAVELAVVLYSTRRYYCTVPADLGWNEGSSNIAAQAFLGGCWYHYPKERKRVFFTVIGVGLYSWAEEQSPDHTFGYLLGTGVEFTRHFQMIVRYAGNQFILPRQKRTGGQISVMVRALAY